MFFAGQPLGDLSSGFGVELASQVPFEQAWLRIDPTEQGDMQNEAWVLHPAVICCAKDRWVKRRMLERKRHIQRRQARQCKEAKLERF